MVSSVVGPVGITAGHVSVGGTSVTAGHVSVGGTSVMAGGEGSKVVKDGRI